MKHANQLRLSRVILFAALFPFLGASFCGFHLFATTVFPPFDGTLDIFLHVILGLLKVATIFVFPFVIRPLYKELHGNPRNVIAFVLVFALGHAFLSALYVLLGRELLAVHASNDVVRFYYFHSPILDEFHYIGLEAWREEWARFIPQAKEMLVMTCCLTALVVPAYFWGSRRRAIALSSVVIVLVCVMLPSTLGLVVWDYDLFLGGIFFDLLSLDLIPLGWWHVDSTSIVFFALATIFYGYVRLFCRIVAPDSIDDTCVLPTH
jgi:hypothetical protein